jgi:hypothetical protein
MRRYLSPLRWLVALALTFAITSGCDTLGDDKGTPTTPRRRPEASTLRRHIPLIRDERRRRQRPRATT